MTDTTTEFRRQVPRNLLFHVLSFVLHVGIGVLLVPYLLGHLGRAAYGLIPIAGIMTQYVSLISQGISSAVNRFLTISLQRNDTEEANRIFNTAFFSYLALGLIQIPVFGMVLSYADSILTIPRELYTDTILLLACSAIAFVLNLLTSVFGVPMYANNRLDIIRCIDIAREVCRFTAIVGCFTLFSPALRYVGYVDLAISVLVGLANVIMGKRLAPGLRLAASDYDWRKVRQLMGMAGWLLISHIGFLLFLRIDIWVCNRFVGAEAAGDYAAVVQWAALLRHGGRIVSGLIAPMVMIYYARSEIAQLIELSKVSVRVFSLFLAVPIAVGCVFSRVMLGLWLGESFVRLAPLMVIMLCHLGINVGVMPLFSLSVAMNRVRWPGLVTLVMGVLNLVLAITLAEHLELGIYGVAIAASIVLTAKNALFTPIHAAIILRHPWYTFLKVYWSASLLLIGLTALGYACSRCMDATSVPHVIVLVLGMAITGFALAWCLLPKRDRQLVMGLLPIRFRCAASDGSASEKHGDVPVV